MTLKSNAEELAFMTQGIGAEIIRGAVRYYSEIGDIAVGAVDIGDYLYELKGQEVVLIVAPLGPVKELPIIRGLCGTPCGDDECPPRRAEREDARRVIEERLRREGEETDRLIGDVEEWLEGRRTSDGQTESSY